MSAAATSAATAIEDPPFSVAFAAVIANLWTFAPSACFVRVKATAPAGPFSVLLASALHAHPFEHSNPPYISIGAAIVTDSE